MPKEENNKMSLVGKKRRKIVKRHILVREN